MIRIDDQLDFAKLVAPLESRYCPDFGRPAIHLEVMIRALLICFLYNIASFRRLCSAISESMVFRWFCSLTIDDPVFDHSTISYFIIDDPVFDHSTISYFIIDDPVFDHSTISYFIIDDPVFDHSTISYFIERIGRDHPS